MPIHTAPLRDIDFVLHEVLRISQADIPGYEDLTPDLTGPVLEEAGKIASNVLAPLNRVGDQEGTSLVMARFGYQRVFPRRSMFCAKAAGRRLILILTMVGRVCPN